MEMDSEDGSIDTDPHLFHRKNKVNVLIIHYQ